MTLSKYEFLKITMVRYLGKNPSTKKRTKSFLTTEKPAMANLLLDAVSAQDLPRQWAKQLNIHPEQRVEIFITTSTERSRIAEFDRITRGMSNQAEKARLTEEKLSVLLNED